MPNKKNKEKTGAGEAGDSALTILPPRLAGTKKRKLIIHARYTGWPAHRSRLSPEKKELAKRLRRNPSPTMGLLWEELRRKKLGHRFHRKAPFFGWIFEFWCPAKRLMIQIKDDIPNYSDEVAEKQDAVLSKVGVKVLRFDAQRIIDDLQGVISEIKEILEGRPLLRSNLGRGRKKGNN